ncbi:MAG: hypothetical protein ACLGH0_09940, partial [Thermoanaerobaculia bacterium]
DVASVDWFDGSGNLYARVRTAPFSFTFVPNYETSQTFTIQASATDLSNNESAARATFTWEVAPNNAPVIESVTNIPDSLYPNQPLETRVTFTDEGTLVTVAARLKGTKVDDTPLDFNMGSVQASRANTTVPFAEQKLAKTIPTDVKAGDATVEVTVTDSISKKSTFAKPLTILADTTPPQILSLKPKSETRFAYNAKYDVEVQVKDLETGIAKVELIYDPSKPAQLLTNPVIANGVATYKYNVTVPPKNADTRVRTIVRAYDYRNNVTEDAVELIWERVEDPTVPTAYWITPLDNAALPIGITGWQTVLRVQATDNVQVTAVKFESTAFSGPVPATKKSGTTDQWEAKLAIAMPSEPFVIKATVSDGDPAHDVELPITINPVALDMSQIFGTDFSISSVNVSQYQGKSVFIRGANTVNILTPVRFKNLILVDGAKLSTLEETKVDIEVTDHLFVDADSFIDLNEKGYLGGLRRRTDANFQNNSHIGRTLDPVTGEPTTNGGANSSANPESAADGSHAGIGGENPENTTNATYGSITDPVDFGSGGGGKPGGTVNATPDTGGNGGGALKLTASAEGLGRFVLAGTVRADGGACSDKWGCGSGGSILIHATAVITGAKTRITANGGSDSGQGGSAGGGGGRLSFRVR